MGQDPGPLQCSSESYPLATKCIIWTDLGLDSRQQPPVLITPNTIMHYLFVFRKYRVVLALALTFATTSISRMHFVSSVYFYSPLICWGDRTSDSRGTRLANSRL